MNVRVYWRYAHKYVSCMIEKSFYVKMEWKTGILNLGLLTFKIVNLHGEFIKSESQNLKLEFLRKYIQMFFLNKSACGK